MRESFRNSPSFRRSTSPTVNVTALASFSGNDKTCAILASACPLARTLRLHFSCNSHNGPLICRPTSARAEICRPTSARAEARTRDRQPRQDSDLLFTLFVDVNSEGTRTRHDCTVVSHSRLHAVPAGTRECPELRSKLCCLSREAAVARGCCRGSVFCPVFSVLVESREVGQAGRLPALSTLKFNLSPGPRGSPILIQV